MDIESTPKPCVRDSVADIYGPRSPYHGKWPIRVDESLTDEPDTWVQSACVLCSNGCGMDIGVKDGKIVGVRGRAIDRVNHGRLGPKGLNGWVANDSKDRLRYPMIRKNGKLERASWDEAMDLIVRRSQQIQRETRNLGIAFYTSGQLFLEEYYTLAMIGKGGLHNLHMDGNTRLCTATAATAMRESFGCDGQPGSYTDIDFTDCIFMVGHNMAATQTVLWTRILDRLAGPNPPELIVMDPRTSRSAEKATLHIANKIGTNLCVLNGIARLLIENDCVDHEYVARHTVGFEELKRTISKYTPEYVQRISNVPCNVLQGAAKRIGMAKRLLSTALQGVYQSNQGTASACAVNNINIIRGMIGKPGCGIYQMNGQPTAQNNREAGCNGEYPGFRNPLNVKHMQEIADAWNIDLNDVPHWNLPTHIMKILQFIETGSIKMLWVSGTNPAVSLPNLQRIRQLFTKPDLFLVTQDIFMTETCELADVVLPAAMWAEKTGCFTNVDRTVHISHKAIDPPGECKSDLEIFCDYARRMKFKDKDGEPLIKWRSPEEAFEAWKKFSEGRPCDYSGMSYEKLSEGSGIQWPCNKANPSGTERLYTEGSFMTALDDCESYGHDLETGAPLSRDDYERLNPRGKAIIKSAHYREPEEPLDDEYPFHLVTGRNVYQFHTRTKTGRSNALNKAASEALLHICMTDAKKLGLSTGDMATVSSRRGSVEIMCKIDDMLEGTAFIPFHYGYWDKSKSSNPSAANEMTLTVWDTISKQPCFKGGAVKIEKSTGGQLNTKCSRDCAVQKAEEKQFTDELTSFPDHFVSLFGEALTMLKESYDELRKVYDVLLERYSSNFEVRTGLVVLREIAESVQKRLLKVDRGDAERNAKNVGSGHELAKLVLKIPKAPTVEFQLLVDAQNLYSFLAHIQATLIMLTPTAAALLDSEIVDLVQWIKDEHGRQFNWVSNILKVNSPQSLIVPVERRQGAFIPLSDYAFSSFLIDFRA